MKLSLLSSSLQKRHSNMSIEHFYNLMKGVDKASTAIDIIFDRVCVIDKLVKIYKRSSSNSRSVIREIATECFGANVSVEGVSDILKKIKDGFMYVLKKIFAGIEWILTKITNFIRWINDKLNGKSRGNIEKVESDKQKLEEDKKKLEEEIKNDKDKIKRLTEKYQKLKEAAFHDNDTNREALLNSESRISELREKLKQKERKIVELTEQMSQQRDVNSVSINVNTISLSTLNGLPSFGVDDCISGQKIIDALHGDWRNTVDEYRQKLEIKFQKAQEIINDSEIRERKYTIAEALKLLKEIEHRAKEIGASCNTIKRICNIDKSPSDEIPALVAIWKHNKNVLGAMQYVETQLAKNVANISKPLDKYVK